MHLVAALAQAAGVRTAIDLGCGIGYSTLWIASAVAPGGSVIGIDDDPVRVAIAERTAADLGFADRVRFVTGRAADVLATLDGPVDMVHDDAWFATPPDHLEAMIEILRPGGLLTMVNWFLLVDARTGALRNDWASFAGPTWAEDTERYARQLADRSDIDVTWVTTPPIAFATTRRAASSTGRQPSHGRTQPTAPVSHVAEGAAPVLHCPRSDGVVTIRPATAEDAPVLVAGRDEEFHRFLGEGAPDPRPVACIVVDGAVVGWVDYDHDREWLGDDEVNLGYHVFAAHRRRGYGTRAVRLLLDHLAADTGWSVATLLIDRENAASLALAQRAGFERVADLDGHPYWKLRIERCGA